MKFNVCPKPDLRPETSCPGTGLEGPGRALDDLCRWAECWLPTLAPADHAGRPVYILDRPLPPKTEATTGREMDLAYQPEIGQRWRGRGVCILIDLRRFEVDYHRLRTVSHADDSALRQMQIYRRRAAIRLLVHEYAHAVLWEPAANVPQVTQRRARVEVDSAIFRPEPSADDRLPAPWHDHGADFVRTCIHLFARAKGQGVVFPLVGMAAGVEYRLAEIGEYQKALGDEPARLRGVGFREIATTPPPRKFADLWQRDVGDWLRSCAVHGGLTDAIIAAAWQAANDLPGRLVTRDETIAAISAAIT